jgi:hypothetical protein
MLPASNFGFLKAHDAQLAQLGALAERYFRDDPGTSVFKLRQFAELLSKTTAPVVETVAAEVIEQPVAVMDEASTGPAV